MKPAYDITPAILSLLSDISHKLGLIEGAQLVKPPVSLRRANRIRTISSTLQIEGNTLTLEQVTDFLDGKRIIAPEKDIREVRNAAEVYDLFDTYDPYSIESICKAHKILMKNLIPDAGRLRSGGVGIAKGSDLPFIAPPADLVKPHLRDLLKYVRTDRDPMLIKSCVFHYEFEFIHPFSDGNGRMGRLWQSILLSRYNSAFEYIPIESIIKSSQEDYYQAFEISHSQAKSTAFVEYMLSVIDDSLNGALRRYNMPKTAASRIDGFLRENSGKVFSRQDYVTFWAELSPATASRDLAWAVKSEILNRTGDKSTTRYTTCKGY